MAHIVSNVHFTILEQLGIPYVVKKTDGKKLKIKYSRDNLLIILIPNGTKIKRVDDFINQNIDWIKNSYQKVKTNERKFIDGESYLYLGKSYQIRIIISKHPTVLFNEDTLYIYTKSNDYDTINKQMETWRYKTANILLNELLYKEFQLMKDIVDKYPELIIKNYKSRWGTCYYKSNRISLNVALIHTEIECIEYVICHELAHFVNHTHNQQFHKLVNHYIDENSCLKKLKKYKATYH